MLRSVGLYLKELLVEARGDHSARSLLAANLVTIALAVTQRWDLAVVMRIYWAQSVIIGFFNVLRILSLEHFATSSVDEREGVDLPPVLVKIGFALFFAAHYGGFHFAYFVFLSGMEMRPRPAPLLLAIPVVVFGVNHLLSFLHNVDRDSRRRRDLGKLIRYPYVRVIPMHLTMLLAASIDSTPGWVVVFLLLKTVADVLAHELDHSLRSDRPFDSAKEARSGPRGS